MLMQFPEIETGSDLTVDWASSMPFELKFHNGLRASFGFTKLVSILRFRLNTFPPIDR